MDQDPSLGGSLSPQANTDIKATVKVRATVKVKATAKVKAKATIQAKAKAKAKTRATVTATAKATAKATSTRSSAHEAYRRYQTHLRESRSRLPSRLSRTPTTIPEGTFDTDAFLLFVHTTNWVTKNALVDVLTVLSDVNRINLTLNAMQRLEASEPSLQTGRDGEAASDIEHPFDTATAVHMALQGVIEDNYTKIAQGTMSVRKRRREDEAASVVESPAQGPGSIEDHRSNSALGSQHTKTFARESTPAQSKLSSPASTPSSGKRIKLSILRSTPNAGQDGFNSRRGSVSALSNMSAASSPLSSPARSRTGSLTASTATPVDRSNSPATAFTALNGIAEAPKKRVKLTFAEKQQEQINKEIRKQERADAQARKEVERREKEQQKAHKDAEREFERLKKEAELEEKRKIKEAQKAEKDKENQIKEAARKHKEAEKEKRDEQRRKKERAQPKLFAFLKSTGSEDSTVAKMSTSPIRPGPVDLKSLLPPAPETVGILRRKPQSEYEKRFPDFYVHSRVKLAPTTSFQRDYAATYNVEIAIDSYISGDKVLEKAPGFEASVLFKTRDTGLTARGKRVLPVKEIMAQSLNLGASKQPIDLTRDSQNAQVKNARNLLKSVPYKFLSFAEDVRPPYQGTYTRTPLSGVRKLGRNPLKKDLPDTDYDYDSEAEWEEPGEGEDLDSDGEEDEDNDGDDDIDGFLDDENDELVNARKLAIQGDMETQSTGLCWEGPTKANPVVEVNRYRMRVLPGVHDKITAGTSIDPFSKSYWEEALPSNLAMNPPRAPLNAMKATSSGVNGLNKPVKMFNGPNSSTPSTQGSRAAKDKGPTKWVLANDMEAFKNAVSGSNLSKIGLVEVLYKQFPKNSRVAVQSTIEAIATRVGPNRDKLWVLNENQPA